MIEFVFEVLKISFWLFVIWLGFVGAALFEPTTVTADAQTSLCNDGSRS